MTAFHRLLSLSLLLAGGCIDSEDDGKSGETEDTATGTDGTDGSEDGTDDGTDGGDGTSADCPEEVPEEFRYIWDCDLTSCPGGPLIYRYAEGESIDEPPYTTFSAMETYYVFTPDGWCADTFEIRGTWDTADPGTYRCSECEENYRVTWTMSTDNSCGLIWGSLFFGRDGAEEEAGPWDGNIVLDTHGSLSGRYDRALVGAAPKLSPANTADYYNNNWAYAYTEPTTDFDGPPELYEWSNTDYGGICANGGRMVYRPDGKRDLSGLWVEGEDEQQVLDARPAPGP